MMPHTQVAMVIFMNRLILSCLSKDAFRNGRQKRKTIPPKSPACTSLSKSIKFAQPISGMLSPGRQIKMSTNKNQAMPGKNFIRPIPEKGEWLFKTVFRVL